MPASPCHAHTRYVSPRFFDATLLTPPDAAHVMAARSMLIILFAPRAVAYRHAAVDGDADSAEGCCFATCLSPTPIYLRSMRQAMRAGC